MLPGAKSTLHRIGLRVTRHPRMGAAQQPEVAVRELTENRRLIEKGQQKRYSGDERTLLMGNHMSLNPLARLRPPCSVRRTARASCGLHPFPSSGGAL